MISQVMFNREKWIAAMMLDPDTGLDPPGVKIRAAEGMSAASNFMKGYWIWYLPSYFTNCNPPIIDVQGKNHREPRSSKL